LIDTIAMIGSPAARGAVAAVTGAGRACLAAASVVSAASTAIAASIAMAGPSHRRIALVGCAVVNRFAMSSPIEYLSAPASTESQATIYTLADGLA
jgi:hypothetical protein